MGGCAVKKFLSFILILLVTLITLNTQLCAIILESKKLSDINNYIDKKNATKDTLVVFDIDCTIAELPFGLSQWLDYRAAQLEKTKGFAINEAYDIALPMFFTITNNKDLTPLDNSPQLIKKLQKKKIPTIALTNRSFPIIERTIKQLENINISFVKNRVCYKNFDLDITHKGKYSHGIIFVGQNDKGEMLFSFLEKIKHKPKKIIFIDDRIKYVKSVEKATESRGIEFVGIRFGLTDDVVCPPEIIEEKMGEFRIELGLDPISPTKIASNKNPKPKKTLA